MEDKFVDDPILIGYEKRRDELTDIYYVWAGIMDRTLSAMGGRYRDSPAYRIARVEHDRAYAKRNDIQREMDSLDEQKRMYLETKEKLKEAEEAVRKAKESGHKGPKLW